ncbi:hypothetical protein ACLB2K_021519 [Fragaria x ananassa]
MGKVPVRMKAVVYGLSPFQQKVMPGLWKDLPSKIHHKISENWHSAIFAVGPVVGTYAYVQNYKEKEKLEHSFQTISFGVTKENKKWKKKSSMINEVLGNKSVLNEILGDKSIKTGELEKS